MLPQSPGRCRPPPPLATAKRSVCLSVSHTNKYNKYNIHLYKYTSHHNHLSTCTYIPKMYLFIYFYLEGRVLLPRKRPRLLFCLFVFLFWGASFTKDKGGPTKAEEDIGLNISQRHQGRARTQSPTTRNYAVEIPTFGEFTGVSKAGVQWPSLALGEPPS